MSAFTAEEAQQKLDEHRGSVRKKELSYKFNMRAFNALAVACALTGALSFIDAATQDTALPRFAELGLGVLSAVSFVFCMKKTDRLFATRYFIRQSEETEILSLERNLAKATERAKEAWIAAGRPALEAKESAPIPQLAKKPFTRPSQENRG